MSNHKWTLGLVGILLVFCYFLYQFLANTLIIDRLVHQMEPGKPANNSLKHLILISQELDNPYWRSVEQGAKEAVDKLGMELEYRGPVRNNLLEQMKIIEKSIAAKPDALIVQGINDPQFNVWISKAKAQGIAVITVDTDVPESRRLAYVGTDNIEAGKRIGELSVKDAGEKGKSV